MQIVNEEKVETAKQINLMKTHEPDDMLTTFIIMMEHYLLGSF